LGASMEAPTARSWVFWSTRNSINGEIPSVTAIIETILAVSFYWWVAINFETYLLLLMSVAVAPLVLLRSDESVALGVKWFMHWEKNQWRDTRSFYERGPKERLLAFAMVAICAVLACVIAYLLTRYWMPEGTRGIRAFGHQLAIGAIAVEVPTALMLTVIGELRIIPSVPRLPLVGQISAGALSYLVRGLALILAMLVGARLGATLTEERIVGLVIGAILAIYGLGIVGVSLMVRLGATLMHIPAGVRAMPHNFRRLTLCTSPLQEPELVPGLVPSESLFTPKTVWERFRRRVTRVGHQPMEYVLVTLMMLIWFFPAWLYRVTLKSTAWFWWPLAFLGGDVRQAKHPELFREKLTDTLWARTSLTLAVLTVAIFIASNFLLNGVIFHENPFLSVLGFVFVVDWSLRPWQVLAVTTALISIGILFWIDNVARDYRFAREHGDGPLLARSERRFGHVERLVRFRLLLVIAFWLLVGAHTLLYFNSTKCWFTLSANIEGWAQWVYGDRFPPAHC